MLELERAGVIEVEVLTESGAALAGVEILLVPPVSIGKPFGEDWRAWSAVEIESPKKRLARRHSAARRQGMEWPLDHLDPLRGEEGLSIGGGRFLATRHAEALDSAAWRARTDEQGRVRWRGLPPGPDYRVGWLGSGRARLSPHHEFDPYVFENGRWTVHGRAVDDVTAPLEVQANTATRVGVTAFREASVYGGIDAGQPELLSPSVVKLFHRSIRSAPEGADLALLQMEMAVVPTRAGQFELHGLEPGKKKIMAHWSSLPGQISFASVDFEVTLGESVDLGLLQAQSGYEQTVRIALRSADWRELVPSAVFAPGVLPEVALGIDTLSEPPGMAGTLSELVGIPLGEPIVLKGLPPGRMYLRAQLGDEYELREGMDLHVIEPKDRWIECPTPRPEELTFVATRFVEQRLRILWEGGGPVPRLEAHWRTSNEGLSGRTDLRPPRAPTSAPEYRLMLAAGTYEFLVHAHSLEDPSPDAGWYWTGPLTVSDGAEVVEVKLLRGCAIGGVLQDAGGSPVARRPLSIALPGWGTPASPGWTYKTMTDEHGRYRVSSLVPETAVRTSSGGLAVTTGARGSERAVDLFGAR